MTLSTVSGSTCLISILIVLPHLRFLLYSGKIPVYILVPVTLSYLMEFIISWEVWKPTASCVPIVAAKGLQESYCCRHLQALLSRAPKSQCKWDIDGLSHGCHLQLLSTGGGSLSALDEGTQGPAKAPALLGLSPSGGSSRWGWLSVLQGAGWQNLETGLQVTKGQASTHGLCGPLCVLQTSSLGTFWPGAIAYRWEAAGSQAAQ